jgi:hypothetical protein
MLKHELNWKTHLFTLITAAGLLALGLDLGANAAEMQPAKTNSPAWSSNAELASQILADQTLRDVHRMAQDLLKGGINAGSNYKQVWIRDMNTFIVIALEVNPPQRFREALLTFFKLQGTNGDIVDGYVPLNPAIGQFCFTTNSANSCDVTKSNLMNGMCGTDLTLAGWFGVAIRPPGSLFLPTLD